MSKKLDVLLEQMPKEAISFFAYFARFEYALKRGDYLKGCEGKRAEPDWTRFEERLGDSFFDKVKSSHKADELLAKPPKMQIVKNNNLDWTCIPIHNVTTLFEAIRRARNNLFHGGKFSSGPVEEVSRNDRLLLQCKGVLELALQECETVRRAFKGDFS